MNFVLGFLKPNELTLDEEVEKLIFERDFARKNRDFTKSDMIRDILLSKGIILEDGPEGTTWKQAI